MPKLDDQISLLQERLRQLKLRQQRSDARRKALEAQRERKTETRRQFLVGRVVLERAQRGPLEREELQRWLDAALTRADDRALFGLAPRPESAAAHGDVGAAREAQMPPGGEGDDGDGVGEVEAAARGSHRDEQGVLAADAIQDDRR